MKLELWNLWPGNICFLLCPGCAQWVELGVLLDVPKCINYWDLKKWCARGRALASGNVYLCKRSDWLTGTISHGACEKIDSIKLCSVNCVRAVTASEGFAVALWKLEMLNSNSPVAWEFEQEIGELVGSLGGGFFYRSHATADSRAWAAVTAGMYVWTYTDHLTCLIFELVLATRPLFASNQNSFICYLSSL